MAGKDTLCGWGDRQKIAYFVANADVIIPRRADQLATLTELLSLPHEAAATLVDLGAGFGALTELILARYPQAQITCVDGSVEMLALARERLAPYGSRVRLQLADLANDSWASGIEGSFAGAVSALAIHHLSDHRKRELYQEIFERLVPGGLFLNNDIVAQPLALKPQYETLMLRTIQDQDRLKRGRERSLADIQAEMREQLRLAGEEHQSHIAALRDQLRWLEEAGFTSVECHWKYLDFAVFGGVKA
jgi:tRNA (cmo5U34)-methyltransferase